MPRRPPAGRSSISGVALVLALIASLLAAAPARAAGGTLAGTVTGPDGQPFDYFRVDLYQASGPGTWELASTHTVASWFSGLPVGQFAIPVPAGSYRACFTPAGDLEWAEAAGIRCWRGGLDVHTATDIAITEGGTTTIAPVLPREARLRGRITDPTGAGVVAYVLPFRRTPSGTWGPVHSGDESGPDGRFEITDLNPGTYRFCLTDYQPARYERECWDDVATVADAADVAVPPGGAPIINFRVALRANIAGTVTIPAGTTEPMGVTAYGWRDAHWTPIAWDDIDADGSYWITGLDPGTYRLCAYGHDIVATCWQQGAHPDEATDIVLATGEARTGVDLAPLEAGYVEGTLPEVYLGAEGWPVVTAWRQVGDGWQAVTSAEAVPAGVGNDWTYQVGSLPTGTYVACVHHEQPELGIRQFPTTCNGGSPTPQGGEPFQVVAGGTTTGIDIVTGQAGEIRGRVNGTTRPVRVDLYLPSGRLATTRTTDADGYYRFREIPSSGYYVGFHREAAASGLAAEWWRNKGDGAGLAGATLVPVDAAIVSGISATLDPGGTIAGRLVDSSGDAVAGCQLQARARDGSLAVRRAVTDAVGDFAIGGLSTASYLVLVTKACSGGPTGLYYDAGSPTRTTALVRDADAVAVVRGATTALPDDLRTAAP